MLTDLATWWWHQMLSLLPERARTWQDRTGNALFAEPAEDAPGEGWAAVMLFRRRRRRDRALGRFTLDRSGVAAMRAAVRATGRPDRIVLRLRGAGLLEQRVMLPLAAERGVGQVLLHDMDRMTPFRADQVFWAWVIDRRDRARDRARDRLHVHLTLIPRAGLDPLVACLGDAGIPPAVIETTAGDGGIRRLDVGQDASRGQRSQRRAVQAMAAACAVLAVTVAALPFVRQSLAIARTEGRIAALQPSVADAEALRRRIASQTSGANAVVVERARDGDTLAALAAITDILPDTTFLTDFSLTQRQIAMSGQSNEAAHLISALSADPAIRNPSFAAPVTRTPANSADLFSIHAELAP